MTKTLFKLTAVFIVVTFGAGCVDDSRLFTQGRIQDLCNESIPICGRQAACALDDGEFFAGRFPGGQRVITRTEFEDQRLIVRFLLDEMVFPGTEILVQAYTPDCGDFDEAHPQNVDLFRLAGDDRILQFELDVAGRGDHLVEIFSDMSASYSMTFELE